MLNKPRTVIDVDSRFMRVLVLVDVNFTGNYAKKFSFLCVTDAKSLLSRLKKGNNREYECWDRRSSFGTFYTIISFACIAVAQHRLAQAKTVFPNPTHFTSLPSFLFVLSRSSRIQIPSNLPPYNWQWLWHQEVAVFKSCAPFQFIPCQLHFRI